MSRPSTPPTHLDAALRQASEHARRETDRYAVPALDPSGPHRSGPPRWAPTAAFATVVLALAGLVVAAAPSEDDGADEVGMEEQRPADDLTATTFAPEPFAVGGPRDGRDSVQLPVQIAPSDGLGDEQVVTVTGQSFPPGARIGIVMCAPDGPAGAGAGVDNCDTSTVGYADAGTDGTFTAEYRVERVFHVAGVEVDCLAPPPEGRDTTCVVAAGALSDYDQSGVAPVTFDPGLPLAPDPVVEVSRTDDLDSGDVLTVTLRHLTPGAQVWIDQCFYGDDGSFGCVAEAAAMASGEPLHSPPGEPVVVGDDGSATVELTVHRKVDGWYGPVDCMSPGVRCVVMVNGAEYHEAGPLHFIGPPADATAPPVPGTASVEGTTTETTVMAAEMTETTTATTVEGTDPSVPPTTVPAPTTTIG